MIPFADHCVRVERYLLETAGIRVVTREIPAHLIGDLDGCEIHIDNRATAEQRLFLLGHLFGHTVQWNTDPEAFELGKVRSPPVAESLLPGVMAYERDAACYALGMFDRAGVAGLAQWFSDYTACDMAYLLHYYRTGEKAEFVRFWQDFTKLIEAKPALPFTPTKRVFRLAGVVI